MKKRYCPAGSDEYGNPVFIEHGSRGSAARIIHGPAKEGQALPPGRGLALVQVEDDGQHVVMEDLVDASGGPAQVATESYRRGWDATFKAGAN